MLPGRCNEEETQRKQMIRYKRRKGRQSEMQENSNSVPESQSDRNVCSIGIQTDNLPFSYDQENVNVLFCNLYLSTGNSKCDSETLTVLTVPNSDKNVMTDTCFKRDCGIGVDLIQEKKSFCGYKSVEGNENSLLDIAGVKIAVFQLLLSLLPTISHKCSLTKENMLLLFLMKMKLGLAFSAIAVIFRCHRTTASANFKFVLHHIYQETIGWISWPQRFSIRKTMPNSFKTHYENCTCIIDCTEIQCERLTSVRQRILMFSHYKNCFTVKFLVAITPSGFICFLSRCYGGRATDSYITVNSGLLDHIEPGDVIMSDKGFPQIKTCIESKNAIMVMPPFAFKPQFSPEEIDTTYNKASARIHVERGIQRMKTYKILCNKFTIDLLPHVDKIVHVSGILANLSSHIIKSQT